MKELLPLSMHYAAIIVGARTSLQRDLKNLLKILSTSLFFFGTFVLVPWKLLENKPSFLHALSASCIPPRSPGGWRLKLEIFLRFSHLPLARLG